VCAYKLLTITFVYFAVHQSLSALTLLVEWQERHPAWWDAGLFMCLGQGANLHMAQLMPLPLTVSCSIKPRLVYFPDFTFLVPAHLGVPDVQGGCKMVVVVVILW